jgi:hypothetical protein
MKIAKRSVIAFLLLIFVGLPLYAQNDAVCMAIVQDGAHNIGITESSSSYLNSVFSHYCESDGTVNVSSFSGGVSIPSLPVSLTLGASSSSDQIKNFCKTYSSSTQASSSSFDYYSNVVEKALQSAVQCEQIAKTGNTISHHFQTPDTLAINITIGGGNNLAIHGLSQSPNVRCTGTDTRHHILTFVQDTSLDLTANLGTYIITCTRTPHTDNGRSIYSEAAINLSTSTSAYNIYWPQNTVLPLSDADQIQAVLKDLDSRVSQTTQISSASAAKLNTLQTNYNMPVNGTPAHNRGANTASCPPGQYVSGIVINWGGTCQHMCDADGGVVRDVTPVCKPLF